MSLHPEAFFLPVDGAPGDQRFCLYHAPQGDLARGALLYIHPFGEEMNKARRMAALQSQVFAQAGFAVLQMDLKGCGDSSGDFGDASWQDWLDDVVCACRWLQARIQRSDAQSGQAPPLWLWGLRVGCLLAAEAAHYLETPCNFLFWAPTPAGKVQLQQFLRLKAAGDMLAGGAKGSTEELRQQLAAGLAVEVAGYTLSPGVGQGMERSVLEPPDRTRPQSAPLRVAWLELSTREDAAMGPAAQKAIGVWRQAGFAVNAQVVNGPSFWQTSEIEDAPAMLAASMAALAAPTPLDQALTAA